MNQKSGGHATITHQMLPSIIQVYCVIILPRSDKRWWEFKDKMFLAYHHISQHFHSHSLRQLCNKILFFRLILWWGEMNLVGQFFLVGLPGDILGLYFCLNDIFLNSADDVIENVKNPYDI